MSKRTQPKGGWSLVGNIANAMECANLENFELDFQVHKVHLEYWSCGPSSQWISSARNRHN
eukprot:63166-Amphidinium_carterae.1